MLQSRLHPASGIALGPILFIIAILALLAAAIAAGSGSFNASISTENAKAMAEVAINQCGAFQDAMNLLLGNGCDPTAIDYTAPGNPSGSTWNATNGDLTGSSGTNRAGNGTCALFDPRGGGLVWKPLPSAALVPSPSGAYSALGTMGTNVDAFAGYPILNGNYCINAAGLCTPNNNSSTSNGAILYLIPYVNSATCAQIDKILAITFNSATASVVYNNTYTYSLPGGAGVRSVGAYVTPIGFTYPGLGGAVVSPAVTEGCALDQGSNSSNSANAFLCTVLIR
jgi:hypothetical protein